MKYDNENLCKGRDHDDHDATQAEPGSQYCEHCARNMEIHAQWEQERSDREHRRVVDQLDRDRARNWAQDVAAHDRWLANQN